MDQQGQNNHLTLFNYIRLRNEAERYGKPKPILISFSGEQVNYEEARQTLNLLMSDAYNIMADKDAREEQKLIVLAGILKDHNILSDDDTKTMLRLFNSIDKGENDSETTDKS